MSRIGCEQVNFNMKLYICQWFLTGYNDQKFRWGGGELSDVLKTVIEQIYYIQKRPIKCRILE